MRKLSLLLIILSLSLSACNKINTIKPETKNLSFTAVAMWNGTEYVFTALTDSESHLNLTQNSPKENENLKFSFNGDNVTFLYLELEKEYDLNSLSTNSPVRILGETFNALSNNEISAQTENDRYFLPIEIDKQTFNVYISETGLPTEIADQTRDNTIVFKGISILNSN